MDTVVEDDACKRRFDESTPLCVANCAKLHCVGCEQVFGRRQEKQQESEFQVLPLSLIRLKWLFTNAAIFIAG